MLEQNVNVVNWIHHFDPQNVNLQDFKVPAKLRKLDNFSRNATRDYPKTSRLHIPDLRSDSKIAAAANQSTTLDVTRSYA